jgi:hypothetical protein
MMGTLREVETARRYARYGVVVAYGVALAAFVIRLVNSTPRVGENLWGGAGAIAVAGMLAIAPTTALLALRGRPRLLPAAAVVAFAEGLFSFSLVGLVMMVPALLWINAYGRWPRPVKPRWPLIVLWPTVVIAAVCAFVVLFIHQDPMCTRTYGDGTVQAWAPAEGGGWAWQGLGGTSFGTEFVGDDGVQTEECTSDIITWWEALATLGVSGGAVGVAAWGGSQRKMQTGT